MKNITKEEYQKMLDEHDWYYEMSDDKNVYNRGLVNKIKLMELTINNPIFESMYYAKFKTIKL